jgi:TetR/AcrR family transcriptional regulator
MLLAMAEAVGDKGYPRTSVADVLKRSRVSRETFYQHFADKEQCFLSVLDQSALLLERFFDQELSGEEPPLARFERALEIYLDTLAGEPSFARVFFLESYAAGEQAQRKRFAVQERFVQGVTANFGDDPAWRRLPDPEFAGRMLVGAVSSLVAGELVHERGAELAALRDPIMDLLRSLSSGGGADPARPAAP